MNDQEEAKGTQDALQDAVERVMRHQSAGRLTAAHDLLEDLLADHPGHATLTHYKGANLIQMGKAEEGFHLIEEALQQEPDDPMRTADYGAFLARSGELEKAAEKFREAVEMAPNYAIARSNLGAALVLDKKYGEAITHLERAIELDTNLLDAHTNLGIAYMHTNQYNKAVDVLFRALAIDPQDAGAHIHLSSALYRRERHEAAEHHARRAIELRPDAAEAYLHLGNALSSSGKMEEAAEAFLKVAGRPPAGLPALSRLIHMRKTKADSPEFQILEQYIDQEDKLGEEGQATLHYAAGKAFDDLADYEKAFFHLRKGNDINKKLHPYDQQTNIERAERLRAFGNAALLKRCGGGGISDVAPIFICGMPRSGTTLMDQMFSRHPEVQAGGELRAAISAMHNNQRLRDALEEKLDENEIVSDDFNRLGESYVAGVHAEGIRSEYLSDKMPSNYLYIGMLALALPRAKFLIMRRHPLDCLFSNYMQHFGQNQPFSTDFENLSAVYRQFDLMAQHWSGLLPDRVRQVHYEDVTSDTEGQMREILDFVGLKWDPAVLDYKSSLRQVNTASLAQVREPVYRTSVARWRHYGPLLKDMANEIRDFLTEEELQACGAKATH